MFIKKIFRREMFDELKTPYRQDQEPRRVKTLRLTLMALVLIGIICVSIPVGIAIKQYFFTIPASGETNLGEMTAYFLPGDVDPIETINYGIIDTGDSASILIYCRNEMSKAATVTGVQMIDQSDGAEQLLLTATYTPVLIQPMDYMQMALKVTIPANFTYAYWSFNIKILYEA